MLVGAKQLLVMLLERKTLKYISFMEGRCCASILNGPTLILKKELEIQRLYTPLMFHMYFEHATYSLILPFLGEDL